MVLPRMAVASADAVDIAHPEMPGSPLDQQLISPWPCLFNGDVLPDRLDLAESDTQRFRPMTATCTSPAAGVPAVRTPRALMKEPVNWQRAPRARTTAASPPKALDPGAVRPTSRNIDGARWRRRWPDSDELSQFGTCQIGSVVADNDDTWFAVGVARRLPLRVWSAVSTSNCAAKVEVRVPVQQQHAPCEAARLMCPLPA